MLCSTSSPSQDNFGLSPQQPADSLESRRNVLLGICTAFILSGCKPKPSPVDAPIRYTTIDKLREKLKQVAEHGWGGSSLGGIPESIEELMKDNPEKGKKLLEAFQRLNVAVQDDDRKVIAQEMIDML